MNIITILNKRKYYKLIGVFMVGSVIVMLVVWYFLHIVSSTKGNSSIAVQNQDIEVFQEFYPNGILYIEGNYDKNNQQTGQWSTYFKNGNIWKIENYINGELNGQRVAYYENGQTHSISNFKDGVKDGEARYYLEDGTLVHLQNFRDNKKNGKEIDYFDTGEISGIAYYINGKRNGIEKIFFKNEKIYETGMMEEDMRTGVWKVYNPEGVLVALVTYENGIPIHTEKVLP